MIAAKIIRALRNHGEKLEDQAVWDWLNMVWMSREPDRALSLSSEDGAKPTGILVDHIDPTFPQIEHLAFATIALYGMQGCFDTDLWELAIKTLDQFIDPATEKFSGCGKCWESWQKYKLEFPPDSVEDEQAAAKWVHAARNAVRASMNKPPVPFEDSVVAYHWAFLIENGEAKPV